MPRLTDRKLSRTMLRRSKSNNNAIWDQFTWIGYEALFSVLIGRIAHGKALSVLNQLRMLIW